MYSNVHKPALNPTDSKAVTGGKIWLFGSRATLRYIKWNLEFLKADGAEQEDGIQEHKPEA